MLVSLTVPSVLVLSLSPATAALPLQDGIAWTAEKRTAAAAVDARAEPLGAASRRICPSAAWA